MLLVTILGMSSCLTIVEEITIKKDGSGSYRFAMDGSKIKETFGSIGKSLDQAIKPDSSITAGSPDTLIEAEKSEKKYELTARLLAEKNGVTHSRGFNDSLSFQTGFEFDFQSLSHLQDALVSLKSEDVELGGWDEDAKITMNGRTLKRHSGSSSFGDFLMEIMDKKAEEDGDSDGAAVKNMMKMMFRELEFKTIYHFPDQKIKKCNDKKAQLSNDRHTLTILEKPFDEKGKSDKKPTELVIRLK